MPLLAAAIQRIFPHCTERYTSALKIIGALSADT